jgi:hypothetical protein
MCVVSIQKGTHLCFHGIEIECDLCVHGDASSPKPLAEINAYWRRVSMSFVGEHYNQILLIARAMWE